MVRRVECSDRAPPARLASAAPAWHTPHAVCGVDLKGDFLFDLPVRIHFIIEMIFVDWLFAPMGV